MVKLDSSNLLENMNSAEKIPVVDTLVILNNLFLRILQGKKCLYSNTSVIHDLFFNTDALLLFTTSCFISDNALRDIYHSSSFEKDRDKVKRGYDESIKLVIPVLDDFVRTYSQSTTEMPLSERFPNWGDSSIEKWLNQFIAKHYVTLKFEKTTRYDGIFVLATIHALPYLEIEQAIEEYNNAFLLYKLSQ